MLINNNSGVFGNVPCDFFGPLLIDKTAKSSNIDIFSFCHGVLYYLEECLNGLSNVVLLDTGLLRNLCDYLCFSHCV